jgi:hypothetical protein
LNGVVAIQGEAVAFEGKVSYLAISTDFAARAFLIRLQGCACTGAAIFLAKEPVKREWWC